MTEAIIANNIWKKYKIGQPRTLTKAIPSIFSSEEQKEFWALRAINLKVYKGETVGIIGPNGSGKSTILKILAGITIPTKGSFWTDGRITSLLELGAGFHPELTGRENVYLYGALLGLNRKEVDKKFREIVHFSEIGRFLDTPLKHYSSGMQVRLAFSIAVSVRPDILLIDEVFAVGDAAFQEKGLAVIKKFKNRGVTMAIASHDLAMVENTCDRVILLKKGRLVLDGTPKKIISAYLKLALPKKGIQLKKEVKKRWGDGKAKITDIWLEDNNGKRKFSFEEETIKIKVKVKFFTKIEDPIFGLIIRNQDGMSVFESNTFWVEVKTGKFKKDDERLVVWELKNNLNTGSYSISPAIAYSDGKRFYDWKDNWIWFMARKNYRTGGILNFNHKIEIK